MEMNNIKTRISFIELKNMDKKNFHITKEQWSKIVSVLLEQQERLEKLEERLL